MIEVKGINFEVVIIKKRIKNIYLRLEGNLINASCPYYVPNYEVYKFIESKRNWIYNAYIYNNQKPKNKYLYREGETFYIFGEEYKLIRSIGKLAVNIVDKNIYFSYKDNSEESIKALYKQLDRLLLNKAIGYFNAYRKMLLDYGYVDVPELKARLMTSKWGVCYTKNNKITINSYLIHYPLDCLEYIMVHEMTHFIIPNHSKRFYEIISNNMPNYKQADNKLK